jgi:hypothetical protein
MFIYGATDTDQFEQLLMANDEYIIFKRLEREITEIVLPVKLGAKGPKSVYGISTFPE